MIPIGARVHHRGCLWNFHFTEEQRQKKPSWGWGTVKEAIPQTNGSFEYRVLRDMPLLEGMPAETWWASYHIDRWEPK